MHNLDTNGSQTAFVSARQDAWHSLGTTLPAAFTAEQAMEQGHLGGWNVRKAPMFTADTDGTQIPIPGINAVLRDNPFEQGKVDVLTRSGVSDQYHIIQNEEHAALLNALVDESGAHFETAGAIDGGRRVFVTMRLPEHIEVGGVDRVDQYIAAVNSHDGSMAFTLMVTPVRIVCQNTLNVALGRARNQFRIRHTSGAERLMIGEARQALDMTFKYLGEFQEQAERLINTSLAQSEFERLITEAFGVDEEQAAKATVTRANKRLDEMVDLYAEAQTQKGIRGTAWAGFNALTEWADHFAPVRGDDHDTSRATKALLDPSFKNRALDLMLSV